MDCDVVVCGAGGSGLVAAVRLAQQGKRVIVLEKNGEAGGNTWYAGGFRTHYSKKLREAGEPDTRDEQIRKFLIDTLWKEDPQLVYNIYQATEHLVDWLIEDCDCQEDFVVGNTPFGGKGMMFVNKTGRKFPRLDTSIGPGGMGSFVVEKLLAQCEKLGVPVLLRHEAKELLQDKTGRVTGVRASDGGGDVVISARAVVLATGCFSHNAEYLEKATPGFFAPGEPVHRFSVPTCTGDGITMGMAAGADIDWANTKALMLGPAHHPFGFAGVCICRENEVVMFNQRGERWANETENTMALRYLFLKQPDFISWAVVDQNLLDTIANRLADQGRDGPDGVAILRNYQQEADQEALLDTPVKKADTLEELAEKMGVPVDTFVSQVQHYNDMCRAGRDTDFFKDPKFLVPLEKGPYYAFFEKRFQENAAGGMKIDSRTRVKNTQGSIIPGLYATGDNARGILIGGDMGTDYVERYISALTWSVSSGFIASEAIDEDLGMRQ
jgi:fumarate reductase flavoprotein subunit